MLIGAGFVIVLFAASYLGSTVSPESELGQAMSALLAVSLAAAIVFGIWGVIVSGRQG